MVLRGYVWKWVKTETVQLWQLTQVTDPTGTRYQPAFPQRIDKYVKSLGIFPSTEVVEAVKDLRPKSLSK